MSRRRLNWVTGSTSEGKRVWASWRSREDRLLARLRKWSPGKRLRFESVRSADGIAVEVEVDVAIQEQNDFLRRQRRKRAARVGSREGCAEKSRPAGAADRVGSALGEIVKSLSSSAGRAESDSAPAGTHHQYQHGRPHDQDPQPPHGEQTSTPRGNSSSKGVSGGVRRRAKEMWALVCGQGISSAGSSPAAAELVGEVPVADRVDVGRAVDEAVGDAVGDRDRGRVLGAELDTRAWPPRSASPRADRAARSSRGRGPGSGSRRGRRGGRGPAGRWPRCGRRSTGSARSRSPRPGTAR